MIARTWIERIGWVGLTVLALIFATGVGLVATRSPWIAVATGAAVAVLGVAVVQPALVPVLALPLSVVVLRVGSGGLDMTVSDLALGLAFWPAVLLAPRPFSRELRQLLWLNAIYQAGTLLTLVANPYLSNSVEWFHAWLLISGALIVGWAVGRVGLARLGLSLFLISCLALTIGSLISGALQFSTGNFSAVYPQFPWPMHKNFIGTLLCFAAILAYAHPSWMGWSRRWAMTAFWLFTTGIALSQSRQALLGLGVALLVISFRRPGEKRRSALALLGIVPAAYLVLTLVRDQVATGNVHNSVFQRLTWFRDTLDLWEESPLFGHGLRYWTTDRTSAGFQPPNAFLEVLASAGVIGLLAFIVMFVGILTILWRLDPVYGTVAFALVLARLSQAQFDLFWISITVSVPFLIAGVALGAHEHDHTRQRPVSSAHLGSPPRAEVNA